MNFLYESLFQNYPNFPRFSIFRMCLRIWFTEANDVSQKFYGLLGGRISFSSGKQEVSLWCTNILDKDYALFYFDSGLSGFMQRGRGIQAVIDLRFRF